MFLARREEGQGLVEYALILVLVAIVVIAILLLLGPVVGNVVSTVVANLYFRVSLYLLYSLINYPKSPVACRDFSC